MIRLPNVKVALDAGEDALRTLCARKLAISENQISQVTIYKKSIDARKKSDVCFVMTLDITLKGDEQQLLARSELKQASIVKPASPLPISRMTKEPALRPVVVGTGPAGLFVALWLAKSGARPIVIERGSAVDARKTQVDAFASGGAFSPKSNIQFGEGGAGTFSDGKLTTGIKDPRCAEVLRLFVEHGAPSDILSNAKAHIGTDHLIRVVRSMREQMIALGAEVRFETCLTDLTIADGHVQSVTVTSDRGTEEIMTDTVLLAIGHSARDTFEMLHLRGIEMQQKPFSVGARIEHPQSLVNVSQYGPFAAHPALGAAEYKLSDHLKNGRGVYTFCMCPGGTVVAAASEEGGVCTNGMSLYARNGENANSALLVSVDPTDFPSTHPLAGMQLQREIERAAFKAGNGTYKAPAQLVSDFLAGRESRGARSVQPTYMPGVIFTDLRCCLPENIITSMKEGIQLFDRKLHGFALSDAVLTGPETRSSSPVRINRGSDGQSLSLRGLYPVGEGAGYAGGIMSAAVDGLRAAQTYLDQFLT